MQVQHSLLDQAFAPDAIPPFLQRVLSHNSALAISISGGKDSDAMLRFLSKLRIARGWQGETFALFCDLGRIEWPGVLEHLHKICAEVSLPLVKLFPNRSMIDEWQHRYDTIAQKQGNKPFWSSASARFCTDREKTQPSNKFFRGNTEKPFWSSSASRFCTKHEKTQPSDKRLRKYDLVICAIGIRAEESTSRAKKPRYQVRDDIASVWYKTPAECKTAEQKEAWAEHAFQKWLDSGRKGRFALSWHPIHHWTLEEVWNYNGTSADDVARRTALYRAGKVKAAIAGFPCHWAYAAGNSRLSCALCVLASTHDIINGSKHNPATWAELALMEIVGGWGFQQSRWLASLHKEALELSFADRRRLFQTLHQLGLLRPWNPLYSLNLLAHCPIDMSLFWQDMAFLGIAEAIAHYWTAAEQAVEQDEAIA